MNRHIDREREMKVIKTESNKVSKNKKTTCFMTSTKKSFIGGAKQVILVIVFHVLVLQSTRKCKTLAPLPKMNQY